jgi:hypothetical protein
MIAGGDRRALPIGKPTVLVDGFVRATWKLDRARGKLELDSLGRLTRAERADLAAESERLATFLIARPA